MTTEAIQMAKLEAVLHALTDGKPDDDGKPDEDALDLVAAILDQPDDPEEYGGSVKESSDPLFAGTTTVQPCTTLQEAMEFLRGHLNLVPEEGHVSLKRDATEIREEKDDTGREHKGKGEGGGQFTSGSGGGGKSGAAKKASKKADETTNKVPTAQSQPGQNARMTSAAALDAANNGETEKAISRHGAAARSHKEASKELADRQDISAAHEKAALAHEKAAHSHS
jgi:hypothetical protein